MVHVQMYQCENRPYDWPFSKLFECDSYKKRVWKNVQLSRGCSIQQILKKEGEKIEDKGGGERR